MQVTFDATRRDFHLLSRVLSPLRLFPLEAERIFALLLLFSDLWLDDRDDDCERLLEGIIEERGEGDSIDSSCRRRRRIGEVH